MLGKELIYDEKISGLERTYIKLLGVPINGLRIRARRLLPYIKGNYKKVLDAGCGQGIFTFEMCRRLPGSQITGFDIDDAMLERNRRIAGKLGLSNCGFEHVDLTTMDIHDRFDLVLNVDNLEHIENDSEMLRRFYAALAPGGELLLHVPGYYRRWLFFGWAVNFDVEGHFRPGYTKEQILGKITGAGFEIIESYYTYGWIETITNNISYWITQARMKRQKPYALVFPFLLFFSYFGRNSRPAKGAGVLVRARKPSGSSPDPKP